jgi:hypothetical protein
MRRLLLAFAVLACLGSVSAVAGHSLIAPAYADSTAGGTTVGNP